MWEQGSGTRRRGRGTRRDEMWGSVFERRVAAEQAAALMQEKKRGVLNLQWMGGE